MRTVTFHFQLPWLLEGNIISMHGFHRTTNEGHLPIEAIQIQVDSRRRLIVLE